MDRDKKPEDFGEILFKFDVLYSGWEVDDTAYVVRDAEGVNRLVMSDHGHWHIAQPDELNERIAAYEKAIQESYDAIRLISRASA